MDSSQINAWAHAVARINYHAGRLAAQPDAECFIALCNVADMLERNADARDTLALFDSLPSPPALSPPPVQGLGLTWAPNLTPRDRPDNPFSPRAEMRKR